MPPPSRACCAHDHDCEAADCGVAYSLYAHVAIDQVRCLNEATPGSCRSVLRPWHERLRHPNPPLRSNPPDDDDEPPELLLHIPFDGSVKLKAISVIAPGPHGSVPALMRAYVNREGLDWASAAELPPVQEWELAADGDVRGVVEYPTQVARFTGVHALDLLLRGPPGGGAALEVGFVGLKGEFAERRRQAVETVYEARPVPGEGQRIPGIGDGAHWHA